MPDSAYGQNLSILGAICICTCAGALFGSPLGLLSILLLSKWLDARDFDCECQTEDEAEEPDPGRVVRPARPVSKIALASTTKRDA